MTDELARAGLLGDRAGAEFVRRGHFAYESGDHGDAWLALELLFAEPRRLQGAAARLAQRLREHGPDLVCAPLVGGAFVGHWVARELDVMFVYAEPQAEPSGAGTRYAVPPGLRRALSGRRAVVVDDVINAGSATTACVREIESLEGSVVALASLIVRESAGPELRRRLGVPLEALVTVPWSIWPASNCPLCRSGTRLSRTP